MTFERHPVSHIRGLLGRWEDVELQFSVYKYKPQTVFDYRAFRDISSRCFSLNWLENEISNLSEGEELAFHSLIKTKGTIKHLPMIDFSCHSDRICEAQAVLSRILSNDILSGLIYYDSGRSLHAYGSRLLTRPEWVKFMGSLLLANLPDQEPIIDSRWVGHRLIGGFSSLRWSSNSGKYLKTPARLNV